jgi:hypothetical protein
MSSGSTSTVKSGTVVTSSLIRASNFSVPTTPTLRPKLRNVPRKSFSMAMAFATLQTALIGEKWRGQYFALTPATSRSVRARLCEVIWNAPDGSMRMVCCAGLSKTQRRFSYAGEGYSVSTKRCRKRRMRRSHH